MIIHFCLKRIFISDSTQIYIAFRMDQNQMGQRKPHKKCFLLSGANTKMLCTSGVVHFTDLAMNFVDALVELFCGFVDLSI
jgi:hypothetical protein